MALTEEQLKLRKSGIGSSDVAAIVGLSTYASPIDIWLDKTGRGRGFTGNVATRIGDALEPLIAQLYAERVGARLSEPRQTHVHPEIPWMLATPDRIAHFDSLSKVVECKHDSYGVKAWGEEGTDEIPDDYMCQVNWQLDVMGLDEADVAALIGQKLSVYHVRRDDELCAQLREAAAAFWRDHVLADVQPPIDGSDGAKSYLARKHPDGNGLIVAASTADDELADKLSAAKRALDTAETNAETLMNMLRERIGDNDGMQGATWKATWKKAKDGRKVDWEAVAHELRIPPEVLAKHTKVTPGSRRFIFKITKEG